jgi:hypothetical protein
MLLQCYLLTTYSEAKYDIKPKNTSNTTSSKPANGLLSAPHPVSEGVPSSDGEEGSVMGSGTLKSVCFPHTSYYLDLITAAG